MRVNFATVIAELDRHIEEKQIEAWDSGYHSAREGSDSSDGCEVSEPSSRCLLRSLVQLVRSFTKLCASRPVF